VVGAPTVPKESAHRIYCLCLPGMNLIRFPTFVVVCCCLVGCKRDTERAEQATPAKEAAQFGAVKPDCTAAVANTIHVIEKEQGSNAFFKAKDIPALTQGCEKVERSDALLKCSAGATSVAQLKGCADLNEVLKAWASAAP
jgi:hypothetical protein